VDTRWWFNLGVLEDAEVDLIVALEEFQVQLHGFLAA
jgi:hypothetical protein